MPSTASSRRPGARWPSAPACSTTRSSRELAAKHEVTPAQLVLRWHVELGNVVLTRSVTPARIAENVEIFGFALGDDDLEALAGLDRGTRTGPDPDTFG